MEKEEVTEREHDICFQNMQIFLQNVTLKEKEKNKPQLTCYVIHIKRKTVSNSLSNCTMTEPKIC